MRQYVLNQRGQIADADEFDYSDIAHEFLEWLRSSADYLAAVGKPWTRANTMFGRVGLSGLWFRLRARRAQHLENVLLS